MIINELLTNRLDWSTPVKLSYEWMTTIKPARNGGEQRSAVHTWPRRTIRYKVTTASADETAHILRRIQAHAHRIWGVPVWPDRMRLSSQADAGQPVLAVDDTAMRVVEVGAPVIILDSAGQYEMGHIQSFAADQITLADNLLYTWSAGTLVYPLLQGRISPIKMQKKSSAYADLSVLVTEEPDTAITRRVWDAGTWPQYLSASVFNAMPNWADPPEIGIEFPHDLFRGLSGSYMESDRTEADQRLPLLFSPGSRSEIWTLLCWFNGNRGRWGKYWLPSHQRDIEISAPFGSGDDVLTVSDDTEWATYWQPNDAMGRHVMLRWPDGTEVLREITGATTNTITLDSATGKAATADELAYLRVSWLWPARSEQDEIELVYKAEERADIDWRFKSLLNMN